MVVLLAQRYKHEIRTEDRQPLKELLRRQYHHQVRFCSNESLSASHLHAELSVRRRLATQPLQTS